MRKILPAIVLLCSHSLSAAQWSANITGVNNYLFNGVSQTDKNPALQLGINWQDNSGFYAGSWASHVDFGEGTKAEWDGYIGYFTEYRPGLTLDTGFAQYTYHGTSDSAALNFPELYLKLGFGSVNVNFWYSYDYFGYGGGHYIITLDKTFSLNDNWSLLIGGSRSESTDTERYSWEGKSSFEHWQLMLNTQYHRFDIALGVHGTTLKERWGETALLLSIGRTFYW